MRYRKQTRAQPPPTGGKSTSALGKRSCPPDGAQLAGMKAAGGLNPRANGHSGFFLCPDALNGNRIIITPPQGWLGSRGRQPLRRQRGPKPLLARPRRLRGAGPPHPPSERPRPAGRGHAWALPAGALRGGQPLKCRVPSPWLWFIFGGRCAVCSAAPRVEVRPDSQPTRLRRLLLGTPAKPSLRKREKVRAQPERDLHNCREFELLITTCKLPTVKV